MHSPAAQEYDQLSDKVKLYERVLLPSLGFDTLIELPHQYLLLLQGIAHPARCLLALTRSLPSSRGTQ